jgi:hypothetical protein
MVDGDKELTHASTLTRVGNHETPEDNFDDFILDFEKVRLNLEKSGKPFDKDFLPIFAAQKKVIYDWAHDVLWVIDGENEDDPRKRHCLTAWDLDEASGYRGLTSADSVLYLLVNGVDVDIRNAVGPDKTFKTSEDFDRFLSDIKLTAQRIRTKMQQKTE